MSSISSCPQESSPLPEPPKEMHPAIQAVIKDLFDKVLIYLTPQEQQKARLFHSQINAHVVRPKWVELSKNFQEIIDIVKEFREASPSGWNQQESDQVIQLLESKLEYLKGNWIEHALSLDKFEHRIRYDIYKILQKSPALQILIDQFLSKANRSTRLNICFAKAESMTFIIEEGGELPKNNGNRLAYEKACALIDVLRCVESDERRAELAFSAASIMLQGAVSLFVNRGQCIARAFRVMQEYGNLELWLKELPKISELCPHLDSFSEAKEMTDPSYRAILMFEMSRNVSEYRAALNEVMQCNDSAVALHALKSAKVKELIRHCPQSLADFVAYCQKLGLSDAVLENFSTFLNNNIPYNRLEYRDDDSLRGYGSFLQILADISQNHCEGLVQISQDFDRMLNHITKGKPAFQIREEIYNNVMGSIANPTYKAIISLEMSQPWQSEKVIHHILECNDPEVTLCALKSPKVQTLICKCPALMEQLIQLGKSLGLTQEIVKLLETLAEIKLGWKPFTSRNYQNFLRDYGSFVKSLASLTSDPKIVLKIADNFESFIWELSRFSYTFSDYNEYMDLIGFEQISLKINNYKAAVLHDLSLLCCILNADHKSLESYKIAAKIAAKMPDTSSHLELKFETYKRIIESCEMNGMHKGVSIADKVKNVTLKLMLLSSIMSSDGFTFKRKCSAFYAISDMEEGVSEFDRVDPGYAAFDEKWATPLSKGQIADPSTKSEVERGFAERGDRFVKHHLLTSQLERALIIEEDHGKALAIANEIGKVEAADYLLMRLGSVSPYENRIPNTLKWDIALFICALDSNIGCLALYKYAGMHPTQKALELAFKTPGIEAAAPILFKNLDFKNLSIEQWDMAHLIMTLNPELGKEAFSKITFKQPSQAFLKRVYGKAELKFVAPLLFKRMDHYSSEVQHPVAELIATVDPELGQQAFEKIERIDPRYARLKEREERESEVTFRWS